ncbi:MAG: hypothetical protein LBU36_02945, partial [Clostridiales bacterium]|nr:hypothetical protein [Clostridiales bacterium]
AFVFTKNIDKRNNTTAYTAKAADINEFSDLSIGDRVTIPDEKLGLGGEENLRILSVTRNLLDTMKISLEICQWRFGAPNREESLAGQYRGLYERESGPGPGEQITIDKCVALVSAPPGDRFSSYEISGEIPAFSAAYDVIPSSPIVEYEFGERPDVFYINGYPTTNKLILASPMEDVELPESKKKSTVAKFVPNMEQWGEILSTLEHE